MPDQNVIVRRTMDASFLNGIANSDDVLPHIEAYGPVDLTEILRDVANIALVTEYGGFVLILHEPGRYEVHSMFAPGHGAHAGQAMFAAQEWMFTRTDCESIISKVRADNKRAKGLALAGGLRAIFSRDDCEYVELPVMEWAMRTQALEFEGERFHAMLTAAKDASGSELPEHLHDGAHERAVGAALLMIERGQVRKGVAFYNRWARWAGYQPITLLSEAPLVIDAGDGVAGQSADNLGVLLCR